MSTANSRVVDNILAEYSELFYASLRRGVTATVRMFRTWQEESVK